MACRTQRNIQPPVLNSLSKSESSTKVGHFNIWPTAKNLPLPNHNLTDWGAIADELFGCDETRVTILNHPRDLHSGTRPFGPELHKSVTGANLNGFPTRFSRLDSSNSRLQRRDLD